MDRFGVKWEDICGPKGLQPWDDESKDFGQCFEKLFLHIPICFVIAIISGYYVGYRKFWVVREKAQERIIIIRSFVVLALVVIPIIELYVFMTTTGLVLYPVEYFSAGTSVLSWLVHFGYVLALKHRLGPNARGPLSLIIMWSLVAIVNVLMLRSYILAGESLGFIVATLCCHGVYLLTLLPSSESRPTYYSPCLVGSQHTHSEYTPLLPHLDEGVLGTAMQGTGFISSLTFSWVNPLLQKGIENNLYDPEELFDLPPEYRCSYVGARMDRSLIGNVDEYQQYAEIPHEPFIASGYGATSDSAPQTSTPVTPTARVLLPAVRRQNVTLLRALHACFALQFYSIGLLKLVSDMAGFAGPLLLNRLVAFVEDETIDQHLGYMYAGGLLGAALVSALFNVHFNWLMSVIGLKMRGALVATILRKTLSVTSTELTSAFSVGEVTNFMSTDTDRIVNSCPSFHALWSIPLQLFITLFLLYQQVGVSFLAGVAFSVLLVPVNRAVAVRIGALSTQLMRHKDARVSLVADLLRGIRTVKIHVWENYFIHRIGVERNKELKYLRGRKYLDAICVVLWATTPVLVAALTLGTHALRRMPLDAPTVGQNASEEITEAEIEHNTMEIDHEKLKTLTMTMMTTAQLDPPALLPASMVLPTSADPPLNVLPETPHRQEKPYKQKPRYNVFTTIALINMLISPLNAFPWVLNGLMEAWVSIKRIQKLIDLPDMQPEHYYDKLNTNHDEDKAIIFKNATFSWVTPTKHKPQKKNKGKSKKRSSRGTIAIPRTDETSENVVHEELFMLRDLSFEIGKEELIGVTGNVGSGKTSLLLAIIGEMVKKSGQLQMPENLNSFGYVSQKPWLIRGSLRDNILFGMHYNEAKFRAVVDACALTEDLDILGWNAYVGEGGCTLSGGQRARVALARAVYQEKQVYLLDDVLAGLDGVVAAHIMQRCVLGLLRRTTRVLVAHSPRHLARATTVLLMEGGRCVRHGPPETVLNDIEEYLPSETESIGEEPPRPAPPRPADQQDNVSRNSLDEEEAMSQGSVAWWVIGMYLRAVGMFLSVAILVSLLLMQLSQNFTFLWLTYWVKARSRNITHTIDTIDAEIDPIANEKSSFLDHGITAIDGLVHTVFNSTMAIIHKLDGHDAGLKPVAPLQALAANSTMDYLDYYYLEVYFGLAGLNLVFTIMRAFLFAYGGVKAAKSIHKMLLKVVVTANVKFFDVTPAGRIVNRFSSDTYTVDDSLPFILNILLAQLFSLIGAVVVTVYGLPWLLVGVLPLTLVYWWLQRRYRVTSRQLKRLQSVTLSPVYTHFSDTLEGLPCIRAHGSAGRWMSRGEQDVEVWQRAALCSAAAAQWLAVRLQGSAAVALAAAAGLAVLQRATHAADPGLVGLAISYALSLTATLGNVLNAFTETEREMIAVERVGEYIREVKSERVDGEPPPFGWPSQGVIEFDDVHLKYSGRESATMALNGVTFSSYPGEKLGVVGRTGAGKSSLVQALLRLAPLARGALRIDGVDVSTVQLHALRMRIAVIPQEPFIFTGSVRENVDPLRNHTDAEVAGALRACGAAGLPLDGTHAALSQGRAQMICLARALLHRAQILLVDEATANVDHGTERQILDTLNHSFGGSTILFIAHRATGVLECTRVLVLSGGKVVELRPPDEALADNDSYFYKLVSGDMR